MWTQKACVTLLLLTIIMAFIITCRLYWAHFCHYTN